MKTSSRTGQIKYSSLLNHPHTWDESLRYHCSSPGSRVDPNPILLLRLLERRPENPEVMRRGDDEDDPEIEADRALFTEVRQRLRRQMNERSATDRWRKKLIDDCFYAFTAKYHVHILERPKDTHLPAVALKRARTHARTSRLSRVPHTALHRAALNSCYSFST